MVSRLRAEPAADPSDADNGAQSVLFNSAICSNDPFRCRKIREADFKCWNNTKLIHGDLIISAKNQRGKWPFCCPPLKWLSEASFWSLRFYFLKISISSDEFCETCKIKLDLEATEMLFSLFWARISPLLPRAKFAHFAKLTFRNGGAVQLHIPVSTTKMNIQYTQLSLSDSSWSPPINS